MMNKDEDIKLKYTFVENKEKTWTGVGLTEFAGKYQGVIYQYGKVNFGKENKDGKLPLQFEWNMLDSNGLPEDMINDDFFELIGDILQDLLIEQSEQGELQYVDTDNRENNTDPADIE